MRCLVLLTTCLVAATPIAAVAHCVRAGQDSQPVQQSQWASVQSTPSGHVADSAVGQVGKRQTGIDAVKGIEPTARISSRIQNRVQSRVRNRIDRNYDPQANADAPFATAEEQTRTAGRKP